MSAYKHNRAGFSLLELLVAIVILGVLIALMVPGLGAARRAAQSVKCLTNLNQLAKGFRVFAEDNNGFLPGDGDAWEDLLASYVPASATFLCPSEPGDFGRLTGVSYKWRNDAVAMSPDASLGGCDASLVSNPDVALVFDAASDWHAPGTRNAAALDASARRYGQDEFLDDLQRPIE